MSGWRQMSCDDVRSAISFAVRACGASSSRYDIDLRFSNRGRRTFLCLSKEKYAKERTPRLAQTLLALLGFWPAPSDSTSLCCRSGADSLSAPLRAFAKNLRCSKRARRGPELLQQQQQPPTRSEASGG